MHPALGDQDQRHVSGNIIAEVDFDIVVAGDALVLSASEGVEIFSIQIAQDAGYILPIVVYRAGDRMWRFDSCNGKLCRWNYKSFVDKNVSAGGMIDGHQIQIVVVIRFPQLGGEAQVVVTVARHQLIAANLVPLLGSLDARRADSVNS